jgi:heavy metal sensor kinase
VTLTARLSAFFLAALAVVLAGFSAALYLLADHHLHGRLDDRLDAAARAVAVAAEVDPDGVEWEGDKKPPALGPGGDEVRWAVTADDGRVVARSPQPGAGELLAAADPVLRTTRRLPRTVEHHEDEWRVTRVRVAVPDPAAAPVAPGKYPAVTVTTAVPRGPVRATLHALAAALAGLSVGVLGVGLVAGRWVCRRALRPVTRMADAARTMTAADLDHRLPVTATGDELADLGRAFNALLDRVREAFERQRNFTAEASHQLRTPLAAVLGQVDVALRRDRDGEEYKRVLGAVRGQADRLGKVVEALLFLARADAEAGLPARERVDLGAWVPEHVRAAWAGHPRADDVRVDAAPASAAVHPVLLGELVDVLVDNALKYSPPGTPVAVRVASTAGGTEVSVEDAGAGLNGEDAARVFEPFVRSADARRRGIDGLGLGLAVAKRIAAAHGGTLGVASTPGRGSRFTLHLPAAGADPVGR